MKKFLLLILTGLLMITLVSCGQTNKPNINDDPGTTEKPGDDDPGTTEKPGDDDPGTTEKPDNNKPDSGENNDTKVSYGTDGVTLPRVYFRVDAKGRITSATEESIKISPVSTTPPGVMTAADKVALNGKANKSTSQTITLSASGWSNSSQTVSVSNWTSSMNGICSIAANQSASVVQMAQKSGIFISNDTVNGKLTFSYFKSQPTSDIKMTIIMLG